MSKLQAMVLRYRDTCHGPEAIVIVEIANNGGGKSVFFVQRSLLSKGFKEYEILTFKTFEFAEACFGGQKDPEPAYQMRTTDNSLCELIKHSIGDPAEKPPGVIIPLLDTSIINAWFYMTILHSEPAF